MIENIKKDKKLLLNIALITLIFFVLSNGYGFFNLNISYDSLRELVADDWTINRKFEIGRLVEIAYIKTIRGRIWTPVLVFVGGYFWLFLSVYTFIKLFNLDNKKLLIVLISGIMTTNYVVSDLAVTCPHQLDVNMFALFVSILAVCLWKKGGVKNLMLGGLCSLLSYATYSAYIQVIVFLIVIVIIFDLLEGNVSFKDSLINGLKGMVMILSSIIVFTLLLKILLSFISVDIASDRSGIDSLLSLDFNNIFSFIVDTYLHGAYFLIDAYSVENNYLYIGINVLFIIITAVVVIKKVISNKIKGLELILLLFLCLMLPLFTNLVYFASNGEVKTMLARYAQILLPTIPLILIDKYYPIKINKIILFVFITLVVLNNVQFSNACYVKKDLEDKATLSYLTRVIERIEEDDNYEPGVSKVIFVGDTKEMLDKIPGFENLYRVNGQEYPISTTGRKKFISYFDYVLVNPIEIADEEDWDAMQENEEALKLETFPSENCTAIINDYYVIRLS